MRRNVRRLNREVGGVVVAVSSGRNNIVKSALPQVSENTEAFDIEDPYKKGKINVTKKAANLNELKRYCKAAEEAAKEMLLESQQASQGSHDQNHLDVQSLANIDENLPLRSPSRMVALQLANGNPTFREKLKKKLEESGVTFEMDDAINATGVFAGFGAQSSSGGSRPRNQKAGKPPLPVDYYDTSASKSKLRSKRKAPIEEDMDDYSRGGNSSLMRRRRKTELQISVNGTAAQIHTGYMNVAPPNGTPYRNYGYVQHPSGQISPLTVDKQVVFGDDMYASGGLGSLGNLINLPLSDTPGKSFVPINANDTPRFDFDEVIQSFPSPRGASGLLGSSPSRWSAGSAGSAGSFSFPESRNRDSVGSLGGVPGSALKGGILSQTMKTRRHSGGVAGSLDVSIDSDLVLPSPMSGLPSPTFADISVSFLNAAAANADGAIGGEGYFDQLKSYTNLSSPGVFTTQRTQSAVVSSDEASANSCTKSADSRESRE